MPIIEGGLLSKTCLGPPTQGHLEKRKSKKTPAYATLLKWDESEHPRDKADGRFIESGSGSTTGDSTARRGSSARSEHEEFVSESLTADQRDMQIQLAKQAAKPIHKVKTPEEGVALILKGENVELHDTKDVHTVLKQLGEMAMAAKAAGKDAVNFDPCLITVKGTSLFCSEKITTPEFPHGLPRIEMPQFKTKNPTPGSPADKLPRDSRGEVDAAPAFLKALEAAGVATNQHGKILARKLKASQAEMEGVKVAGMMLASGLPKSDPNYRDPKKAKIWVSNDGYVIDGHHTWAASVGRDAEDGNLNNDKEMDVVVVDLPMSEVYHLSTQWTRHYGLPSAGVKKWELSRLRALAHH